MASDRKVFSEYVHRRRVQFYETDAAGIVHFSWFFRYMEEAEHALWRARGPQHPSARLADRLGARVRDVRYKRPLRFEDEFDVTIRIAAMSRKTIRYSCVLTKDDVTLATGIDDRDLRAQRGERADEGDGHSRGDRGALRRGR